MVIDLAGVGGLLTDNRRRLLTDSTGAISSILLELTPMKYRRYVLVV
jgi:hypothetical protein